MHSRRVRRQRPHRHRHRGRADRLIVLCSATSVPRRLPAASTTLRCSRVTPRCSTSVPRRAACGKRRTTGRRLRLSSTTRRPPRLAMSPSLQRTQTSCGLEPARTTTVRARPGATGFSNRRTAARRGATWACAAAPPLPASSSIRSTSTWCTSRLWGTSGAAAAIAASTKPPTADRPGSARYS